MNILQTSRWFTKFGSFLLKRSSLRFAMGILFGFALLVWLGQFIATFGCSLPLVTGLFLGIAIPFELAWSKPKPNLSKGFKIPNAVSWGILAVWLIIFPWILSWETSLIGLFSMTDLSLIFVQLCIAFITTLLGFFIPVFVMTTLICQSSESQNEKHSLPFVLIGISAGVLFGVMVIAPVWGLQVLAIFVASIAGLLAIINFVKPSFVFDAISSLEINMTKESTSPPMRERLVAILFVGMMFAILLRIVSQLFPGTFVNITLHWITLLVGAAIGLSVASRFAKQTKPGTFTVSALILFASAWTVVVLALFPQLTHWVLETKTFVSSVWMQKSIQLLMVSVILLPFGFVWGCLSLQITNESDDPKKKKLAYWFSPHFFVFVTGYLITSWGIVTSRNSAGWVVVISLLSLMFPCWQFLALLINKEKQLIRRRRSILLAVFCLLIISGSFVVSKYQPALSARLLFRTDISFALQQGTDFSELSAFDEGRLIDQIEGEQGTYTLWQHRGGQLLIRENGILVETISTNQRICPASSTSVMQVLFPWVLHENPQSILLLGLQGGTSVQTSLELPTKKVVCIEEDRALQKMVHQNIWSQAEFNPFQDERFQLLSVNPTLATCSERAKFDLIISSNNQTSLMKSTSCLTKEFYEKASKQLTEDGIFCQRFSQVDYGPMPLLSLLKTMQLVFSEVMVIETGASEMILLGTVSEKGLSRPQLLTRLQNHDIRKMLATVGWDWSYPLNLRAFDDAAIVKLLNKQESSSNSVASDLLTFQLPVEMMRSTVNMTKSAEFEKLVADESGKLLKWAVAESEEQNVIERLAEVTGGQKLMANYPDQWWIYRKEVKKQIQQNPRPTIQLVHGEGLKKRMHPDLQRRLKYFTTLGKTKKKSKPTIYDLVDIARFEFPYDPLMSYFLHQELIDIMPRVKGIDSRVELSHRLHSVYYGHRADRSIRNIVDTIHFMLNHPQLYDNRTTVVELDGLLQLLKGRWMLRGAFQPLETSVVLLDIKKTLQVTKLAFAEIERLEKEEKSSQLLSRKNNQLQQIAMACDGGDPVNQAANRREWTHRKTYLTRTLVRPLLTYRDRLLPQHQKEQSKKKEAEQKKQVGGDATTQRRSSKK